MAIERQSKKETVPFWIHLDILGYQKITESPFDGLGRRESQLIRLASTH